MRAEEYVAGCRTAARIIRTGNGSRSFSSSEAGSDPLLLLVTLYTRLAKVVGDENQSLFLKLKVLKLSHKFWFHLIRMLVYCLYIMKYRRYFRSFNVKM